MINIKISIRREDGEIYTNQDKLSWKNVPLYLQGDNLWNAQVSTNFIFETFGGSCWEPFVGMTLLDLQGRKCYYGDILVTIDQVEDSTYQISFSLSENFYYDVRDNHGYHIGDIVDFDGEIKKEIPIISEARATRIDNEARRNNWGGDPRIRVGPVLPELHESYLEECAARDGIL